MSEATTKPPTPSAEARRLIDDLADAQFSAGVWDADSDEAYATVSATCTEADLALSAYVAGLEAKVERLQSACTLPRELHLALADATPGLWHGGHRCDGAISVGLPGQRLGIDSDIPAADACAAAEAVNFVRRLDALAAQETPHA